MESQGQNNKDKKLVFPKKSCAGFDEHNFALMVCKMWFRFMINDACWQMAKGILIPRSVGMKVYRMCILLSMRFYR